MSVEDRSWAAGRSKEEEGEEAVEEEDAPACCRRLTRQLAALADDEKSIFSFDWLCGVCREGPVSDVIPCASIQGRERANHIMMMMMMTPSKHNKQTSH